MSKAVFEVFRRQFDDHFNRELVLCYGFAMACETKRLTKREIVELNLFMMNHPHAKYSLKLLDGQGVSETKALVKDVEKFKKAFVKDMKRCQKEEAGK